MTDMEARALFAKLSAAFPAAPISEATIEVYVEALLPLDPKRTLEAINIEIRTHQWARQLPTVNAILEGYQRLRDKYAPPALSRAPITPEERAANLKLARDYLAKLTQPIPEPGT